jgi:cytochrome P450
MSGKSGSLRGDESLVDPEIMNDRFSYYAKLRELDPVHYDAKLDMYLITHFDDLQTVMRDAETFSCERGYNSQYATGYREEFEQMLIRDGGGYFRDAIMSDPPKHTRVRQLLEKAFTADRMLQIEPLIRKVVVGVIEAVADKGAADAVKDIAVPITSEAMCEQLGLDYSEIGSAKLQAWSNATTAQVSAMQSRDEMLENAKVMCEMQNYLIAQIRAREETPRDDMISDLVHARINDPENPQLTFEEKVSSVRALIVAANDSTVAAICNIMLCLATEPELADQLYASIDDDRLLNRFVEEFLRSHPPTHGLIRMTTRDVELGGKTIPEGTRVMMMYASANEDERQFPCPEKFDMERKNLIRHVSFGGGIHRCIGAALAKMEIKIAAQEIARRLDNIKLAIDPKDITFIPTVVMQSIETLPVTFSRRA